RRGAADHFQLHEQFLRHGRTALRRNHGCADHCPHRRRRQSRADARRAREWIRSVTRNHAFRRKKQILAEGRGPVLLDTITYRISGHSPSDSSSYRSKEEIEHWQKADSIVAFRKRLV